MHHPKVGRVVRRIPVADAPHPNFIERPRADPAFHQSANDSRKTSLLCWRITGHKQEFLFHKVTFVKSEWLHSEWLQYRGITKASQAAYEGSIPFTRSRLKERDARFVPLAVKFPQFLARYLAGEDSAGFALRPEVMHGKGTYRYDFHRPYNDYMASKGMRWVTAYVMRHGFASLLVQNGVSVFKVANWLGDGVEVVQRHYAHLSPTDSDIERL